MWEIPQLSHAELGTNDNDVCILFFTYAKEETKMKEILQYSTCQTWYKRPLSLHTFTLMSGWDFKVKVTRVGKIGWTFSTAKVIKQNISTGLILRAPKTLQKDQSNWRLIFKGDKTNHILCHPKKLTLYFSHLITVQNQSQEQSHRHHPNSIFRSRSFTFI